MKLFVWTDVLCDYTCGMMMAVASDRGTAIDLLGKEIGFTHPDLAKKPDLEVDLNEINDPISFFAYGGG